MSYSIQTHKGTALAITIPVEADVAGFTLTAEFSPNANFRNVTLSKTPTGSSKQVTISLTSTEVDTIKNCFYRVKGVKSGRTIILQSGEVDYAQPVLGTQAVHVRVFGVVGDGATNDTAAMQAAINYAVSQGVTLYSDSSVTILTDQLTVPLGAAWEGNFLFSARTANQPSVLSITGKVDFARATVTINGQYKALYGIRASNFGRSSFATVSISRCKLWGWQFEKTGNNNLVTCEKLIIEICGTKHTTTVTETAETGNVSSSIGGYATYTLTTPIPAELITADAAYYLIYNATAHRIKTLTSTTLEVINLPLGVGGTGTFDIIIGGGLNIPQYGDSGVGHFGSLDIRANPGIGIQQSSLYGHTFNNAVFQVNGIGFACAEYTMQTVFTKPYFESNAVDFVTMHYVAGVMLAPLMDLARLQSISGRLAGTPTVVARLWVIQDQQVSLRTDLPPVANPGARTLMPGQVYAFHRSGGAWTFTINNSAAFDGLGAYFIQVDLTHPTTTTASTLSISLGTANGQTIEGGSTFTAAVTGRTILRIARVGTDWKVSLHRSDIATAITAAPIRVGQTAIVAGVAYIATGIAATTDWKQIT